MDADIRPYSRRCYTFGPFTADCRKRLLWRDGTVVPLTPKAFEILATLIEHRGRVLDKEELLREVWGDVAVEDATLAKHISTLRHALDERPAQHLYVVTVPGRGYEFVATIDEVDGPPVPPVPMAASHAPIAAPPPLIAAPPTPIAAPQAQPRAASASPPFKSTIGWPVVLAAALTIAAGAAVVYTVNARRSQAAGAVPDRGLRQFTFRGGLQREPAWSPDGQWVAYTSDAAGNSDIWVQRVSEPQTFRVSPSPFEDSQPDWSPDGRQIV